MKVNFKDEKSPPTFLAENLSINCCGDLVAISNRLCAVGRNIVYALRLKLIANDDGRSCYLYRWPLYFP